MARTTAGRQTSNKAGVASMGKKLDHSRHGFAPSPSSKRVGGAFGAEDGSSPLKRKPGTAATRPGKASVLGRVRSR